MRCGGEFAEKLTGDPDAQMSWNVSPCYGTHQIIFKHRVELVGWPVDAVEFENPSCISSRPKLTKLLNALQYKTMYLRRLDEAEQKAAADRQHTNLAVAKMNANRDDAGTKRQVRGVATRSTRLRKYGIWSPYEVPEGQ